MHCFMDLVSRAHSHLSMCIRSHCSAGSPCHFPYDFMLVWHATACAAAAHRWYHQHAVACCSTHS